MTVWHDKRSGKWRAQVWDPEKHKMRSVPGLWETRRLALKAEQAALDARGPVGRRTVAQFAARWPESHPSATRTRSSTSASHKEKIKRFVEEHGHRRLDTITPPLARGFCLEHPSDLPSLRAMFADARRDGFVTGNPFSKLGVDRSKGRKRVLPSEWLTELDIDRLIECARTSHETYGPTMAAIVTFAAYTGVRPGELFAVEWKDLKRDTVEIRQSRSKSGELTLPKNNRTREIVFPKRARDAVASMPRMAGQEFVFVSPTGAPLRHGAFRSVWVPVRAAFGRPSMVFYELRHFCATFLWELLPEDDVAYQLGHTDGGALVREVYGHKSERARRARILQAFDGVEDGEVASLRARRAGGEAR
jgi:integrase